MKKQIYLLVAIIVLYLALSLALHAVYGPSYGFLEGEDRWLPDGDGGWLKHGDPADPAPAEPSENVPIPIQYLPIFVPGLVLVLFLFTPLRKMLETPKTPVEETEPPPEEDDGEEERPSE